MRLVVCFAIKMQYRYFCIQEFEALCEMNEVKPIILSDVDKFDCNICPFIEVDLPDYEGARQVVSRSVMIKYILDPFSQGTSYEDLLVNVDKERLTESLHSGKSIKFKVESIKKKIKPKERNEIISPYGDYAPKDIVFEMKDPEQTYMVVGNPKTEEYYMGLEVACMSWKNNKSNFYAKYDLKARPYLGPTSTSHELAFLMANQAELKEGDLVFDPFVGTGSILIACSALKAFCFGSDIDLRVLQGYSVGKKAKKEIPGTEMIKRYDVFANFKYYGLPKPCIVAMDISYPTMLLKKFDAIVCDPPYGVKAGSKKTQPNDVASVKESKWKINNETTLGIFTKKESYGINQIYHKLLKIASFLLKKGGKLVFLFHTDIEYPPEVNEYPTHPCFELVHACENPLMRKRSRHSIKMVKICEPEDIEEVTE
ncbi:unnamed protein product [Moneuplotes crassus]|uniref:Uncharacterized protein n=2 Tax=Euplotes crassus TaxID=5936 RepID=A0AAD1XG25_EUPCR|nr:unnamed protein product [Moneuplotes crassus]